MLRELLTDHPESVTWPDSLTRALGTRGFAREVHTVLSRAREKGLDGEELRAARRGRGAAGVRRGRALPRPVPRQPRQPGRHRLRRPDPPRDDRGRGPPRRAAGQAAPRLRRRVPGHRPGPGRAAPRARRRRPRPDRRGRPAPVDLRLPRRRGARHPRLPDRVPARRRRARPTWSRCARPAASGPRVLVASQRLAHRLALPGSIPLEAREAFLDPQAAPHDLGDGRVVVRTFDTERAEAEHLADLLRRAHLEDGIAVGRHGGPGPLRAVRRSRRCAARSAPPASRSRSPATRCRWSATRRCCR